MKNWLFVSILGALAFASCNRFDLDASRADVTKENAEKVLGITIDPNQDWNSSKNGTITVTADANLYDIAKVQILTESPFMNPDAQVVAEIEAQKGQTVTLDYDAPNVYDRLIAACVDSKGNYFIKGFDIGISQLSFQDNAARKSMRRASGVPDLSEIVLEYKNSEESYNAMRTKYANEAAATGDATMQSVVAEAEIGVWAGKGWENERLWIATDDNGNDEKSLGNGWVTNKGSIYRPIDNITENEKATLQDIFNTWLERTVVNKKKTDNLVKIRNSDVVKLYNNHMISNGTTPITIAPVMLASTEVGSCFVYYYYFNPDNIPAGMDEAQYIKTLPKFQAINLNSAKWQADQNGYAATEFMKVREYLLPYYGDGKFDVASIANICTTDNKIYRFKHLKTENNKTYYLTYTGATGNMASKLATLYDDNAANIANQLWQVFETADGRQILYNIGSQLCLTDFNGYTILTDDEKSIENSFYHIVDKGSYIIIETPRGCLGSDIGVKTGLRVSTDKSESLGDRAKWTMEEYTGSAQFEGKKTSYELSSVPFTQHVVSDVIPAGYKVGLMLRKTKDIGPFVQGLRVMTDHGHGCLYANGYLNTEVNTLTNHFGTATTTYSMKLDDPRMAIFNANGKTYISIEDGSDANYSDLIVELGGYDKNVLTEAPAGTEERDNGIENNYLYSEEEIPGRPYMLLFEDRSITADYDMNDVVLRCIRRSDGKVDLSLLACGGMDKVKIFIDDANVQLFKGYGIIDCEVHELFGVQDNIGEDRFVNTIAGKEKMDPVKDTFILPEGMTIPQFLAKIYIQNLTTGEDIRVARQGEAPTAIILPFDFEYPMEGIRISVAYEDFLNWASDVNSYSDWYTKYLEDKVFDLTGFFK